MLAVHLVTVSLSFGIKTCFSKLVLFILAAVFIVTDAHVIRMYAVANPPLQPLPRKSKAKAVENCIIRTLIQTLLAFKWSQTFRTAS